MKLFKEYTGIFDSLNLLGKIVLVAAIVIILFVALPIAKHETGKLQQHVDLNAVLHQKTPAAIHVDGTSAD